MPDIPHGAEVLPDKSCCAKREKKLSTSLVIHKILFTWLLFVTTLLLMLSNLHETIIFRKYQMKWHSCLIFSFLREDALLLSNEESKCMSSSVLVDLFITLSPSSSSSKTSHYHHHNYCFNHLDSTSYQNYHCHHHYNHHHHWHHPHYHHDDIILIITMMTSFSYCSLRFSPTTNILKIITSTTNDHQQNLSQK